MFYLECVIDGKWEALFSWPAGLAEESIFADGKLGSLVLLPLAGEVWLEGAQKAWAEVWFAGALYVWAEAFGKLFNEATPFDPDDDVVVVKYNGPTWGFSLGADFTGLWNSCRWITGGFGFSVAARWARELTVSLDTSDLASWPGSCFLIVPFSTSFFPLVIKSSMVLTSFNFLCKFSAITDGDWVLSRLGGGGGVVSCLLAGNFFFKTSSIGFADDFKGVGDVD